MENDREIDSVMMNIRNSSGSIMSAAMFSARMTFKLMSFLFRLANKGLVAVGTADKFKSFSNETGGKFTAYNIPLTAKDARSMRELNRLELRLEQTRNPLEKISLRKQIASIEKSIPEIEQLRKLGIHFCVLPKLNGSNQTMQITVSNTDDQLFRNWFGNHLTAEMSAGGEKTLETIKVFTEGNYTILNMPFEEAEELGVMMSDFRSMNVNYAILPDLNVGDGYTQVAIPNAERNKVEQWFNMWKDKMLSNGETPGKMFSMNENSYLNSAECTADNYVNTADSQYQEVQKEFEKDSKPVEWSAEPGKENSEEFVKYMQDDRYEKITINKETLVEKQTADYEGYKKQGLFSSRIPGTYGENEQTLLIPMKQVFSTDNGKTYVAFLDKTSQNLVVNKKDGSSKPVSCEETKKAYDKVDRGFSKVEEMKNVQKTVKPPTTTPKTKIEFKL